MSHAGRPELVADREDDGELRQLTVMFCDLVDSTRLSQTLDPEDLRRVIQEYQHACTGLVRELEGYVAQLLGDGMLVYFGYPHAHEDDPIRALSAALVILESLPELNARLVSAIPCLREHPLSIRIGIHTGSVVVARMGHLDRREPLAVGSAPYVAARLQALAPADSIVISDTTRRLLGDRFVLEPLGNRTLKGVEDGMSVYAVVAHRDPDSDGAFGTPLDTTEPVGREQELALLLDRWEQTKERRGQAVLLRGEAGIGKSRLLRMLRKRLTNDPHTWLEGHCSIYHENSAFRPIAEILAQTLQLRRDEDPAKQAARLEQVVAATGLVGAEVVPLFCTLLSLPIPAPYARSTLAPEARRRRMLESLDAWLLAMSDRRPVILVVEDLHWADPSTLELLGLSLGQIAMAPILLLMTARPELDAPWVSRSELLHLNRLTRQQVKGMVEAIADGRQLPAEVLDQIIRKTDGVPLFVEELTKTVIESDLVDPARAHSAVSGSALDLAIPSTLQDSLMARLDRLGPAKEVAQLASVLGRTFSFEVLQAVCDGAGLERSLDVLLEAELVYKRGLGPAAEYTFKHALIQEIAYHSLLRRRREQIHRVVAEALESRFPDRAEREPESLARHFEEADELTRAIPWRQRAGERAIERSAHTEAIAHLRKGIELTSALPEGPERSRQELLLQVALGSPLMASRGYASREVEDAYGRARELSQEVDDTPQLFRALWGLAAFYQSRAELDVARGIAAQLLELASRSGERELLMLANVTVGATAYYEGAWSAALPNLEEALRLYDPDRDHGLAYVYGQDPGMIAAVFAATCHWHLGRPDHGLRQAETALAQARCAHLHPLGLAFALDFLAVLHMLRGESEPAGALAGEAMRVADEHGFALELGLARLLHGWAQTQAGDPDRGLEAMRQAMTELAATGIRAGAAGLLSVLAWGQANAGQIEEALQTLDAALALAAQQKNASWDAEPMRMKGELLLRRDASADGEAERLFLAAIELAHSQGSRGLELRAAVQLGRLLDARGARGEAHALLAPLYAAYSEGFDTRDLQDARALLGRTPATHG